MTHCTHDHLHAVAQAYVLEREDKLVARTIHVTCTCADCGLPFVFNGSFDAPPAGTDELLRRVSPWASASQTELATTIRPLDNLDAKWAAPGGRC